MLEEPVYINEEPKQYNVNQNEYFYLRLPQKYYIEAMCGSPIEVASLVNNDLCHVFVAASFWQHN